MYKRQVLAGEFKIFAQTGPAQIYSATETIDHVDFEGQYVLNKRTFSPQEAMLWQTPWPMRTSTAILGFFSFLYAVSTRAPAIQGQYQHDMPPAKLSDALGGVDEW